MTKEFYFIEFLVFLWLIFYYFLVYWLSKKVSLLIIRRLWYRTCINNLKQIFYIPNYYFLFLQYQYIVFFNFIEARNHLRAFFFWKWLLFRPFPCCGFVELDGNREDPSILHNVVSRDGTADTNERVEGTFQLRIQD